ncbi:MAG: mechanosensitive ion channel family protein [Oscillospiraceae bacterium]|nr:mechanosensitive ion channel family protein [Oscillospiraceae bacterium]
MEDLVLQTLDQSKLQFGTVSLIKIAVVLALAAAAFVLLTIGYKRLRVRGDIANDVRRRQACRVSFRVAKILVIAIGAVAILQTIGVRLTGLSATLGLVVILLALAVKDALQDIFAGVVIMSDKYFAVGDAVEYEGKDGIVVFFTARTTKIKFLDDRSVMSVANRNISQIRKLTHLVDIDLPLPYELSGREAFSVLNDICEQIRAIDGVESCELKGTQDFAASAVLYKIRFFCEPSGRPDIRRAVLKTIQDGLETADIRIPYQQLDIHQR